MPTTLDGLLRRHHVHVASDNLFQRRARLLQALWREEHGFHSGTGPRGQPLGSRLPLPSARESGANFLSDAARAAACREIERRRGGSGQLIDEDRLFSNLLSSQPLCFNLFADMQADLALASRVLGSVWPERIASVTAIRFEYAPARGDERYTGDDSAFDVFAEHTTPDGGRGFVGIEVKYHENLGVKPAEHKARYDELTTAMGCFRPDCLDALRKPPLEQIWRDHMLAGSMRLRDADGWVHGLYVFLYPEGNVACRTAVESYLGCLSDPSTFEALTLDALVAVIEKHTTAPWIGAVRDRYLAWEKVDRLIGGG